MQMKTIAIMNNKGGVGKTVTAINLADILVREYGKRVILVDCDGQMNLTRFFLPQFDPQYHFTMANLLQGDGKAFWQDNLLTLEERLYLLPGSSELYALDLSAFQYGNTGDAFAAQRFAQAVAQDDGADFCIFDCPPGYTAASVAALLAAEEVVIPMTVDGFSFAGMRDMQAQIDNLRRANVGVRVSGVLLTQWRNSDVVRQGEALLRSMDVPVFRQTIRRTEKVPESTFDQTPIVRYSSRSAASRDYRAWVQEFLGEM